MMDDGFPGRDAEFDERQTALVAAIAARPDDYGTSPAEVAALQAEHAAWSEKYAARRRAELDALAAIVASDTARAQLEAHLLTLAKKARPQPGSPPKDGDTEAVAHLLDSGADAPWEPVWVEETLVPVHPVRDPTLESVEAPPEPRVDVFVNHAWENWHSTTSVGGTVKRLYTPYNEWSDGTVPGDNKKFAPGLAGLRAIVAKAEKDRVRVRAVGSKWSLNAVAFVHDYLVNTTMLNRSIVGGFSPPMVGPAFQGLRDRLVFAQCGIQIRDLNTILEARGLALPTTGASNGQTLAGAVSTGTHGSMHDVGAMQDYVRGLHVVAEGGKHYWIQRASRPVMTARFAEWLGATLIENDDLFLSAVVGFGSFGLVHAMIFEAAPLFLLAVFNKRFDFDEVREALTTKNPDLLTLSEAPPGPLVHFECVLNPYRRGAGEGGAFVRVYYQKAWASGDPLPSFPVLDGQTLRCGDLVSIIGALAGVVPALVPPVLQSQIEGSVPPTGGRTILGTPGQHFNDSSKTGGGTSLELGVPLDRVGDALDAIFSVTDAHHFGAPLALRYVRATDAVLGFTHFAPTTCTMEMPGIDSSSARDAHAKIFQALRQRGIPHAFHWGQALPLEPSWVRATFGGPRVDRWLTARRKLLSPEGRRTFSNDLLDKVGLST
jgi:hypothetical protein